MTCTSNLHQLQMHRAGTSHTHQARSWLFHDPKGQSAPTTTRYGFQSGETRRKNNSPILKLVSRSPGCLDRRHQSNVDKRHACRGSLSPFRDAYILISAARIPMPSSGKRTPMQHQCRLALIQSTLPPRKHSDSTQAHHAPDMRPPVRVVRESRFINADLQSKKLIRHVPIRRNCLLTVDAARRRCLTCSQPLFQNDQEPATDEILQPDA